MIVGEASATVSVSPAEVFEFVLDLDRYQEADHKIRRIGEPHREGDHGTVEFAGNLRGLPGMPGTYPFTLTPMSLRVGSPIAGPARLFLNFEASFVCEEVPGGTLVVHREVFDFKGPLRWVADPALRTWLHQDIADEMVRFKHLIEGGRPGRER